MTREGEFTEAERSAAVRHVKRPYLNWSLPGEPSRFGCELRSSERTSSDLQRELNSFRVTRKDSSASGSGYNASAEGTRVSTKF